MKAALITGNGGLEKITVGDIPKPKIEPGQVIIKVKAVSLNHLDLFVLSGMPGKKRTHFPHIPGGDISGLIEKVGKNVSGLKKGQRVLVDPLISGVGALGEDTEGGLTQYISVPVKNIIPIPENVSLKQAAALPIAYGTAWRMLISKGKLKINETVLILGASGGVGNALVQIAKAAGAVVIAAAGSDLKCQKLKKLGADYTINYQKENFSRTTWQITKKHGADIVVDYTGEKTWPGSILATKKGGRILTCGATTGFKATTDLRYVWTREITIIGSNGWQRKDLLELLNLVSRKKIRPVISKVLPLKQVKQAYQIIEDRNFFGKIIIEPN